VQFTDLSTNNPVLWEWVFEGGTPAISALQVPLPVTYFLPGEYDVTLTVINEDGNNTKKITEYITVLNTGSPMAKFSADTTIIEVGNQVQFFDETTGNPSIWLWTFKGGSPGSFEGQNPPLVTYDVAGSYDVSLKAANQYGTHTSAIQDYIIVTNPHQPVSGFSSDKTNIKAGDSVLFTNESTGYPSTYLWTFEGGAPSSFAGKTPPEVVYSSGGIFSVTLTVTNPNGSNTLTRDNYISVSGIGIDEGRPEHLLVYPNPATDKIMIEAEWIIPHVMILDVFGKCLLRKQINAKSGLIDVTFLTSGIYILSIKTDAVQIYRKIVIK
jgi:PKD repeat protein